MTSTIPAPPTVDTIGDTVIGWGRHLHRHPELSFHEESTSRWDRRPPSLESRFASAISRDWTAASEQYVAAT
jgi:hypothetical protein